MTHLFSGRALERMVQEPRMMSLLNMFFHHLISSPVPIPQITQIVIVKPKVAYQCVYCAKKLSLYVIFYFAAFNYECPPFVYVATVVSC